MLALLLLQQQRREWLVSPYKAMGGCVLTFVAEKKKRMFGAKFEEGVGAAPRL